MVLNKAIAPLYDGHPDVDRVVPFAPDELEGLRYLRRVWQVVHAVHYDAIIDMRSTVKTQFFSLFSLGTSYRIGWKKPYTLLGHNYRLDKPRRMNRVEANLMLAGPLAQMPGWNPTTAFRLCVTETERTECRRYMERMGIDFARPVVLCTVTARLAYKVLPYDRMAALLRRFIAFSDAQLIFNYSGEAETRAARRLWEDLDRDAHVFLDIEAKSLRSLCALLVNCDFFFGNEGGPRHMAQALGVPAFAVYPPGIPKSVWLPGDGRGSWRGLSPDDFCPPERQKDLTYVQRFDLIPDEELARGLEQMWNEMVAAPRKQNAGL